MLALRASRHLVQGGQTLAKSLTTQRTKHTLPDLPYDYNALEPIISAEIMQFHHSKHHATYVANLNVAEEKLAEAQSKKDVSAIIQLGPALRFNGGGHLNHSLFWNVLCPNGSTPPAGRILFQLVNIFARRLITILNHRCPG
jgi:Fe-Mn family superoxide dismutase